MESYDYINPIEASRMMKEGERIASYLYNNRNSTPTTSVTKVSGITFYNILQEVRENEDIDITIIDCRTKDVFEESHIVEALNIPYGLYYYLTLYEDESNVYSTVVAVGMAVCHYNKESGKQYIVCCYGDNQSSIDRVSHYFQLVPLPLHIITSETTIEAIKQNFSGLLNPSFPAILPICIIPHRLFITAQEADRGFLKENDIRSVLSIRKEVLSLSSLKEALNGGGILLQTDNLYSRYSFLTVLLVYHMIHKDRSIEECIEELQKIWKSFKLDPYMCSLKNCQIDNTGISYQLLYQISQEKCMNRIQSICDKYDMAHLPVYTRLDTEAITDFTTFMKECIETWQPDEWITVLNYSQYVIGYAYIETVDTVQLILSLIDMILHLQYTQASERNKPAFPRLILKILSQLFATSLFLPALLTYKTDILSYLTCYHMKDRLTASFCNYCITSLLVSLSHFSRHQYSYTANVAVIEWLSGRNEEEVDQLIDSVVQECSKLLLESIIVYPVNEYSPTSTEMMVIACFCLMNYFSNTSLTSLIPSLISRYNEVESQAQYHNSNTCIQWLKEAWVISTFESLSVC